MTKGVSPLNEFRSLALPRSVYLSAQSSTQASMVTPPGQMAYCLTLTPWDTSACPRISGPGSFIWDRWAVVDDRSSKGLHNVYTEGKTVEQFRKTGKFPDGASLVKEIWKLESGELVADHPVVWESSLVRWFVMNKDANGRLVGNPL